MEPAPRSPLQSRHRTRRLAAPGHAPILAYTGIEAGPAPLHHQSCTWQAHGRGRERRVRVEIRILLALSDDLSEPRRQERCACIVLGCKPPSPHSCWGATLVAPSRTRRQCAAGGRCTGGGAAGAGVGSVLPVCCCCCNRLNKPASLKGCAAHGTSKGVRPRSNAASRQQQAARPAPCSSTTTGSRACSWGWGWRRWHVTWELRAELKHMPRCLN